MKRGLVARLLIVITTSVAVNPSAHAALIDTPAAVASDRERILVLVHRPHVGAQLEAYGVKPADAKARIAALTDAEVGQLAADIDDAPAGGFIIVLLAVYGILVVLQFVAGVIGLVSITSQAISAGVDALANPPSSGRPTR